MGTLIVHPEPGFEKTIAKELLALADNPMLVEYVMWPKPGFRIPDELFQRWMSATVVTIPTVDAPADGGVDVPAEVVVNELQAVLESTVEPVKRKPGRPKKNVEGQ